MDAHETADRTCSVSSATMTWNAAAVSGCVGDAELRAPARGRLGRHGRGARGQKWVDERATHFIYTGLASRWATAASSGLYCSRFMARSSGGAATTVCIRISPAADEFLLPTTSHPSSSTYTCSPETRRWATHWLSMCCASRVTSRSQGKMACGSPCLASSASRVVGRTGAGAVAGCAESSLVGGRCGGVLSGQ